MASGLLNRVMRRWRAAPSSPATPTQLVGAIAEALVPPVKTPMGKHPYCSKCGAAMGYGKTEVTQGFDPATGRPSASYWLTWRCPKYIPYNSHDSNYVSRVSNEPQ